MNEPLHDPPNQPGNGGGNYIEALGGAGASGWEWVLNAFRLARTYFPNAELLINEYSVTNNTADMQRYVGIVQLLQAENLIDGVGIQGHAFSTRPDIPSATHIANLNLMAATGLPLFISELDIDGPTDDVQLADYKRIFPLFWEHPAVQGVTLWGFRPGHWRTAQGAYLVHENGAERPAMVWLHQYVRDNVPVVTTGQSFNIDAALGRSKVIGTVVATDADSGATLSGWQIMSGNEAAIFALDAATGVLSIANPLAIDFKKSSYTLSLTVSDGLRTSAAGTVKVKIPDKVKICHNGRTLQVSRHAARDHLRHGDCLGSCSRH